MKDAWELFWNYERAGLGHGDLETYNTILQGIAKNFHRRADAEHEQSKFSDLAGRQPASP